MAKRVYESMPSVHVTSCTPACQNVQHSGYALEVLLQQGFCFAYAFFFRLRVAFKLDTDVSFEAGSLYDVQ